MKTRQILLIAACGLACAAATVPARKPPIPAEYKVKLDTTKGDVIIQVHHDWSPLGADHFYQLVTKGYYDNNAFFRVLKGYIVQFGMNGDPKVTARWNNVVLKDDPHNVSNKVGTVTFAKTSKPDSRTTHIFINLDNNGEALDADGFTPFGEVISGMDNVSKLYAGYGDGPPSGAGPDQEALTHGGNTYLKKEFPNLDYIIKATVIDPPPPAPSPASAHKSPTGTKPKQ
jgi:peptidyl-prolyl cis-trans isomerase A (cyclophilin A)